MKRYRLFGTISQEIPPKWRFAATCHKVVKIFVFAFSIWYTNDILTVEHFKGVVYEKIHIVVDNPIIADRGILQYPAGIS